MCAKSILRAAMAATLTAAASLAGCRSSDGAAQGVKTARLVTGPVAATFTASPLPPAPPADPGIRLVYADPLSRTLATALVTVAADGRTAVESTVVDRIAEAADESPEFGSHAYARLGDTEYLCYLDRAADGKLALKQLERRVGADTWTIDLIEPPGRPLCLLSSDKEVHLVRSDEGGVVDQRLEPSRSAPNHVLDRSRPQGSVSVVRSPSGDTLAFLDAATGTVALARLDSQGLHVSRVAPPSGVTFGGPIHARLDTDGRLCLLVYDSKAQDLLDLVDVGGLQHTVRVTRAREVSAVSALATNGKTLYLYAETTSTPSGKLTYALSLLEAVGSGRGGANHLRIHVSPVPYLALEASIQGGELWAVTMTDSPLLIRVPLARL